jgi:hypothetical protein
MIEDILESYGDHEMDILIADGFNEAIIGIDQSSYRIIYSMRKCLEILIGEGMTYEDALEHFHYNVSGAYVGEQTPIWCDDTFGM